MALSNWLGRDEWAACYWLGMREIAVHGASGGDLSKILRAGIGRLTREGYTFLGIKGYPDGNCDRLIPQSDGSVSVMSQFIDGTFDGRSQAQTAIDFCKKSVPQIDMKWLSDALGQPKSEEAS